MLFSSAVFIFAFLPVCLILFYSVRRCAGLDQALWVLLIGSLYFYSYWYPPYLALLTGSIVGNFYLGQVLSREGARRRGLLIFGIALNLAAIFYFKYFGFFTEIINLFPAADFPVVKVALPLGISFFTFQQITYLVDSYEGTTKDHKLSHYALFVTFFPQLIAGPIVHHTEIIPQFLKKNRPFLTEALGVGISIFAFGLFKKIIIADGLAEYANSMFSSVSQGPVDMTVAWGGVLAYTLQLYFDFSGYSDMAIGLGKMCCIDLPLNFNSPYKAVSISDFWRRWHMTLSRFLRDYVYIPMGGSRAGSLLTYRNLFLTMVIGGIWHGAGWTFIFWGTLHGAYLLINHGYRAMTSRLGWRPLPAVLGRTMTFVSVVWAWVFFRADSFGAGVSVSKSMLGLNGIVFPERLQKVFHGLENYGVHFFGGSASELLKQWIFIIIAGCIVFALPNVSEIFSYNSKTTGRMVWKPRLGWALIVAVVLFASVREACFVQSSDFLYFDF
jgi:D-alanyl-lipoteichoic acid acyltransferase DltB (MBOAT superfamily)